METHETYKSKVLDIAKKSKTFCPMLWNHVTITPNSTKHFCCIAREGDDTESLKEYWDGEIINRARKQMINNQRPRQCEVCWTREDAGLKSHRHSNMQMFTKDYDTIQDNHWKQLYENISASSTSVFDVENKKTRPLPMPHQPHYYDIKFGNLCNLKCRMCNPESSSQVNKEAKSNIDLYKRNLYPHKAIDDSNFLWFRNENTNGFWQDFNEFTKDTYKFKFTGGEPLLIDEVIQFLQKLVKENKAKDIMLHLITNATKINEELLVNTLLKFKTLKINVSVDGVYDHYEYIRYPGKWKKIDENMKLLRKHEILVNGNTECNDYSKMQLSISPVLQTYNMFNMIDIYKYAELIGTKILDMNFVEDPQDMAPKNLTREMKNTVIDYYSKHISELKNSEHIENIKGFTTYLSNTEIKDKSAINTFVEYTKTYDKLRNQNFKDSCPKEYELFREYFE